MTTISNNMIMQGFCHFMALTVIDWMHIMYNLAWKERRVLTEYYIKEKDYSKPSINQINWGEPLVDISKDPIYPTTQNH